MSQEKGKWQGLLFLFAILIAGWAMKNIKQQMSAKEAVAMPAKHVLELQEVKQRLNETGEKLLQELRSGKASESYFSAVLPGKDTVLQCPQPCSFLRKGER